MLRDNEISVPAFLEKATNLTPFAVEFRYDFLPAEFDDSERINRLDLSQLAQETIAWAELIVSSRNI